MGDKSQNDNWLRAGTLSCPRCCISLYRVDHSPMYDEHFLYCDSCANRVEVSYYDPVYSELYQGCSNQEAGLYATLMAAIEERLRPCGCGGRFKHDAPRRCHNCLAAVIVDEPSVDLWPAFYGIDVDGRDPTSEECEMAEQFAQSHILKTDIWM